MTETEGPYPRCANCGYGISQRGRLKECPTCAAKKSWLEAFNLLYIEKPLSSIGINVNGHIIKAGANLAGAYLSGANLAGVNLTGANLIGANLAGANLIGANLINADLSNADLSNSCLSYDFSYSYFLNWEDDLPRSIGQVTMHLGSYSYVTHKGKERKQSVHIWKRWNGEDWVSSRNCTNYDVPQNANAFQANLSGANLSGAHLVGVNLAEADLNKANLVRTNLSNANLRRTNFENANLSGANLLDANLEKANFHGAIRDGSHSNNKGTHKAYYDAKLKAQTERAYPKPPGPR